MASFSHSLSHLRTRWPILRQIDLGLVVGIAVAVLCLGVFFSTAEDVVENDTIVFIDQAIADELHQQGLQTPTTIAFYKAISFIGLPGMWVMGIVVGVIFLIRRQWLHLVVWAVALIGGILVNNIIKSIFARPRPFFPDPFVIEQQFSFPSGHAMIAMIGYGMLAYMLLIPIKNNFLRIILVFGLILLIILMGISRIALGVHFFSDVIGGYAAGGAWLALCVTVLDQFERRQLKTEAAKAEAAG